MKRLVLLLPLSVACDAQTQEDPAAPALLDTEAYLEQEVLVRVDSGDDGVARMLLADRFELTELEHNETLGVARMVIDDEVRTVKALVAELEEDHRVVYAEPNYLARTMASTNDAYVSYQWHLDSLNVEQAWQYNTGAGITVAVLDTGVRSGGPDGITNLLSGYDFYYGDSDPTDNDGHGTFVASQIGQRTGNGTGVAGVAPDARILPVKVMSDQGYGDINAIANGVVWSAQQGADVINMSLGSPYSSRTLQQACDYAAEQGAVVVAATGNEFARSVGYPAAYDSVFAVGASRVDGSRAGYSNYGSGMDFLAPGGDLSRDDNGDGYADGILQETIEYGSWTYTFWEGTSMASPNLAGVAALVLAEGDFTPDEVYSILAETARDAGSAGYDTQTGYGVVNAGGAVALAASLASGGSGGSGGSGSDGGSGGAGEDPGQDEPDSGSTGPDTTPPEISGEDAYVQGRSFQIMWTTDEPATSYVEFEGYGTYGNGELTTSHTLSFNGARGSTYTITILSADAAGNTSESGPWTLSL